MTITDQIDEIERDSHPPADPTAARVITREIAPGARLVTTYGALPAPAPQPALSADDWATIRSALNCTIDDYAYRAEYASMTSTDTDELKGYLDAKQRYVELLTRLERTR